MRFEMNEVKLSLKGLAFAKLIQAETERRELEALGFYRINLTIEEAGKTYLKQHLKGNGKAIQIPTMAFPLFHVMPGKIRFDAVITLHFQMAEWKEASHRPDPRSIRLQRFIQEQLDPEDYGITLLRNDGENIWAESFGSIRHTYRLPMGFPY